MTAQRFQTEVQEIPGRPDVLMLLVQGRISYHEAPEFREIIFDKVANTRGSVLVVDLGGVEQIDTAGLAVLLEGLLSAQLRDLQVLLCQPSESVVQVFRMANLNEALEASCTSRGEVEQRLMS